MFRCLFVLVVLSLLGVASVSAQGDEVSQEFGDALLALADLDHYTVTWEIEISEQIALWDGDELTHDVGREITLAYTDHYQAGAEHFTFQRLVTATEQRLYEGQTVMYTAEIRIVEGTIYLRTEVLEGEMSSGCPREWVEWRYPDQWPALEDLLPDTYFAAVELNNPLPLFDLAPDTVAALTAGPVAVDEADWHETAARRLVVARGHEETRQVLQTRPSLNMSDPYDQALLGYLTPASSIRVMAYFDQGELIGIEDYAYRETTPFARSVFEDGAPDNLSLSVSNTRTSAIDFRDVNADFVPVDAPPGID